MKRYKRLDNNSMLPTMTRNLIWLIGGPPVSPFSKNGYYREAQGDYKKHALSGKARTTVLYAASPRSSQVEVPNSLTIYISGSECRGA
jgi:hypothetical protein